MTGTVKRFTDTDGRVYKTSSGRRYVLFGTDGRGDPYIIRRSDDVDKLLKVGAFHAGDVIIDFGGERRGLFTTEIIPARRVR